MAGAKVCGIYCRGSSEWSIDPQLESCRAFIGQHETEGWQAQNAHYVDIGRLAHRSGPGIRALLDDVVAGVLNIVVIDDLSRLPRLSHLHAVIQTFLDHKVLLASASDRLLFEGAERLNMLDFTHDTYLSLHCSFGVTRGRRNRS